MTPNFAGVTPAFAEAFAADWIAAWNAHDLDRVLAHYDDDFTMTSPFIVRIVGEPSGRLQGKAAIGAYWRTALERNPDLHFALHGVTFGADSVVLHYESLGGRNAMEYLRFDPSTGLVIDAAGHYDR